MTIDELVADARRRLADAAFAPSGREAALLLGALLELSEAQILARGEQEVDAEAGRRFEGLLRRRLTGEPVAYLLGRREFFGRDFVVDRRVLIPRPETEHLIEAAGSLPLPSSPRILDVGTGSGCIAITLALECPRARVLASDLSPGALAVATGNARRLGATNLSFLRADLTSACDLAHFDLVVSNPPYISPDDAPLLSAEVREFEPALALFAPEKGLGTIERLLAAARGLRAGSFLALEIGDGQSPEIEARLPPHPLEMVEVRRDYAGKPRVVVLRRA